VQGSGGATGGSIPGGECKTSADCGGGTCAPVTPGGYLVCLHLPPEVTSCVMPVSPSNQCCTSADCKQGKCYSTESLPYCGGPAMEIYNACMSDTCTTDADCVTNAGTLPEICVPAGAFGYPVRTCFTAYCHTSADCTAHPGGVCAPVSAPCCGTPAGLGCVYPGGCAKNADCGQGNSCQLDPKTGSGVCSSGPVGCPV
jgi:hypothetical protein